MSRRRKDITNDEVLRMLEDRKRYPTRQSIADALGCTATLIRAVANGKRKEKPYSKQKEKKNKELCQCCNTNPKGTGLRFLCNECFRKKAHYNDIEDVDCLSYKIRNFKSGRRE